jgi:hypothetical protein
MLIVPETDLLSVEAKIAPQDIDQLCIGQAVSLQISAPARTSMPPGFQSRRASWSDWEVSICSR